MSRFVTPLLLLALVAAGCNNTASPVRLPNSSPDVVIVQPVVAEGADAAGPFEPDAGLVFEARASDPEDAAAELLVVWTATRTDAGDSEPIPLGETTPDSSGAVTLVVTALDAGRWLVTATVRDTEGATGVANLPIEILEVNLPPTVLINAPTGGSEHIEEEVVTFGGLVNDDRGMEQVSVEWFSTLDGVLDTSPPSSGGALAFSTNDLSVGLHTVTVTVTDQGTLNATDSVTFSVVPANLPPSTPDVEVQPDPAFTGDDLQCVVHVASTDPEGLAVTLSYAWLRDGQPTAFVDSVLDSAETSTGETWTCEVVGSDGVLNSGSGADSVTIENTAPEVGSASLSPVPATEASTLVCTPSGWFDADGDLEGYSFGWLVNGGVVGVVTDTLTGADFDRDDQVQCEVTPDDGTSLGTPVLSAVVLIENTPPVAPSVSVTPGPTAALGDALLCAATGSSDLDGDTFVYNYRWALNGALQPAYDGVNGVPATATSLGDDWTCEAQSDDGSATSAWVSASSQVLPGAGDLVFSEFMADPSEVSDAAGEWVEVYNASGTLLDLGGFELHDDGSDSHLIQGPLPIAAGGRVLLARNSDTSSNGGVGVDYEYTGFVLDNSADEIVLSYLGVEVDRFDYTLASWSGITGHAVSLDPDLGSPDGALNDLPSNWCGSMEPLGAPGTDYGTPGQPNDSCLCFPSDGDGDGFGTNSACSLFDCNDANPNVNPAAVDVCENNVDEDCDGADALCSCLSTDLDNDGYGTGAACPQIDCNDANSNINPGAVELCNGIDDDCDVTIDEGWDGDNDSWTTCEGDCNDGNASIYPGATETCDGIDNNCNLAVDEGWDGDNDNWTSCGGDCNDSDNTIYPGALDYCDGINQDCDGSIDEDATGDVFEPNATSGSSYFIGGDDLIVDLWATFHLTSDGDDWYSISTIDDTDIICDGFYVDVVMDSIPPGTDYDIYLYNSSLTLLASSINVGNASESIAWSPGCTSWGDDGGTYFVRVDRWSGASCGDTYHLQVANAN
ncbi:MAG: lamin tail domain-containing protein [Deltaproteobacteria bacterium]|nr:lamin tail domain-containing protein [Deltaproteobacteria bacterium]